MNRWILSCTTSVTRMPDRDEISECFIHAPRAGFKAWGAAGPLFSTPGLARWANIDLINQCAAQAGLERCTEVYGRSFPTGSVEEARRAAGDRAELFDVAERMGSPLVVITGRKRTETSTSANRWSSSTATAHGWVSMVWART